ncbi:MAG TPA: anti-sigma factor [Casimicrobiaceae bacterium]
MKTPHEPWRINAFVDGELDLASQLDIEARLQEDAALCKQVEEIRALREVVREKADRHPAPAALRERMTTLLEAARPKAQPPAQAVKSAASSVAQALNRWLAWRPLAASMSFAAVLAVALNVVLLQSSKQERLMDEVVASHVRSTLGQHLVDVASSDHHTVKPFLSSRLGFSPPVDELRVAGSVFLGGRVDYLDGRPVAALVYRQGEHVVNSFVWPSTAADSKPEFSSDRGYLTAHWSQGGMNHCVISDVNRDEFQRVVKAVQLTATPG